MKTKQIVIAALAVSALVGIVLYVRKGKKEQGKPPVKTPETSETKSEIWGRKRKDAKRFITQAEADCKNQGGNWVYSAETHEYGCKGAGLR